MHCAIPVPNFGNLPHKIELALISLYIATVTPKGVISVSVSAATVDTLAMQWV